MSLDGPWSAVALLTAVPAGVGHLCHLILAVNIVSGLGRREAVLDRVRLIAVLRVLGLVGPAALGAPAGPLVDLVVAVPELRGPVRGLRPGGLAASRR